MTRPLLPHDQPRIALLGLRLRLARDRRGISAELLAERMGVHLDTLRSLESGDASISLADFYRALRILGLSSDIDEVAVDAEMAGKLLSIGEQK